jgi:osmotically-inducible protein OsmY
MPIVRVSQRSVPLTSEPDAPVLMPRDGASRSATYHPAAVPAHLDAVLREEIERLFAERLDDASEIEIAVEEGCATLQGRVSSSLVKLLAEDLVFSIPEIRECDNALVVRSPHDRRSIAA